MKPNQSAQIRIDSNAVAYVWPQQDGWRVPVGDIRLIGEFTNELGPFADDYFLLFLTREEAFEASSYAEGRDEVLAELGRRLQHELRPGLCNSAHLASRIMWPARLEGHPLFEIVPEARSGGTWDNLKQRILPRVHMEFTDEVREMLEQ